MEVGKLYDRLQVQVDVKFEVMVEGMKRIFPVMLRSLFKAKCLAKMLSSEQKLCTAVEYYTKEIAQIRSSFPSDLQRLQEVVKVSKESIEVSDMYFDTVLKVSNESKLRPRNFETVLVEVCRKI